MDSTGLLIVCALVYMAPWIVSVAREHRDTTPIFVLDLFLGWTFVGWVIALVWALTDRVRRPSGTTRP